MMEILTRGGPPPPPPAPRVPGFSHEPALYITLALWAISFVCIYLSQFRKVQFTIRKVTGLDEIDSAIGRSVEMGRPIFLEATGVMPIGDVGISAFSVIHYIGRLSAKLNAELKVWLQASEIEGGVLIEDNLRQAYTLEGKVFNRNETMRYEGMPGAGGMLGAHRMTLIAQLQSEKPAAYMEFGGQLPPIQIAEELNRANVLSVVGGHGSWEGSVFYDHAIIGEEVIAAGAYLSRDPTLIASIVSSDVMQYVLMGAMVAIAVSELLGFKVISGLTDYWQKQVA